MRMRKKKHADERFVLVDDYIIKTPEEASALVAQGGGKCRLEIGCGKGDFAVGMADRSPLPFIAVEKCAEALLLAGEKAARAKSENLYFLVEDAAHLIEYLGEGSVETLYLNFSDPWPKARHAKRRLTARSFLEIYKKLLAPGGRIEFKTDNRPFFDWSLPEFEAAGFTLCDLTNDLHNSPWNEGNVQTEYERNFSAKGFCINRVVAYIK